jgi:hypothetical protein
MAKIKPKSEEKKQHKKWQKIGNKNKKSFFFFGLLPTYTIQTTNHTLAGVIFEYTVCF